MATNPLFARRSALRVSAAHFRVTQMRDFSCFATTSPGDSHVRPHPSPGSPRAVFGACPSPHRHTRRAGGAPGTFGHVGWVTKVYMVNGAVKFDFTDMNGGSTWVDQKAGITNLFNKWSNKVGQGWDPNVQAFIVAPS